MPAQFVALPGTVAGSATGYGKTIAVVDLNLDGVSEVLITPSLLRNGDASHNQTWDGSRALDQPVIALHYDRIAGLSTVNFGSSLVTGWTMDVHVADFTGDGKLDVLWSDTGPEVFVNGATPLDHMRLVAASASGPIVTNATASASNVGSAASNATPGTAFWHASGVGDFNGDGKLDFIAANLQGGSIPNERFVMGFLGDGHGNFTYTPGLVPASTLPSSIYFVDGQPTRWNTNVLGAGDMNGDGRPDLIAGNVGNSLDQTTFAYARETRIYWNSASGLLDSGYLTLPMPSAAVIAASGHNQRYLTADRIRVADLNGDGRDDVVIMFADYVDDTGRWGQVWLQNPDHSFREIPVWQNNFIGSIANITTNVSIDALEPIDVNGDGLLDIVAPYGLLLTTRDVGRMVFINNGDETFTPLSTLAPNLLPDTEAVVWWRFGDLDADGQAELLASYGPESARTITAYAFQNSAIQAAAGASTSGTVFADTITGSSGADTIAAGLGHDTVRAGAGDDSVTGGAGNDSIESGAGADTVYGGLGADTIIDTTGSNFLRGEDGNDYIVGGDGFDDTHGNMGDDTIHGSQGDDWVVGGKGQDALFGDEGDDIVLGNLGQDTCVGNDGDDIVRGGQGDDIVYGYAGSDYVSGDRGNDTVYGGAGADFFHGSQDQGIDRIMDFSIAEGDRVMLDPGTTYTVYQSGADVIIDTGGGNQMILVGVQLSALPSGWIFESFTYR